MKKFGIIIPHYNSVASVMKLLDTLVNNKVFEYMEVVIIDDKSTENIDELKNFSNEYKNIHVLGNNTEVKGAGVCRNIGLDYLKDQTKWLIFADADDYFEEGFGVNLINADLKYNNIDIVYFNTISRDIESNQTSNRHIFVNSLVNSYINDKSLENELKLRFEHIVPWGKLIKSSLIYDNNIKFDEVMFSNDIMFSTKIAAKANQIAAEEGIIYCVTKSKGSLTTTMNGNIYKNRTEVQLNRYRYLKEGVLSEKEWEILSFYSGKWLIEGLILYRLSLKEMFKYLFVFKKNDIKILPPFIKILNIREVINIIKIEKKYKKNN